MLRRTITGKLNIAAICQYFYFQSHANSSSVPSFHHSVSQTRHFLSNNSPNAESTSTTQGYGNLTTLVDGCDYEHWLVVMKPPEGYPTRHQIVHNYYIGTLALALGSEEEAKKSIYSVSTKYYCAFSCKIPEILIDKIKALPNVRWVLPDSYLSPQENCYGGEPFIDGEVVPYDDKYHVDWLRDQNVDECRKKTRSRKAKRKEKMKSVDADSGLRG
ncbi:hypothetical protein LguiA_003030 [Lonicera macranthoides]